MSDKTAFLSNKQYDALKWLALVGLPALGALYFGLAAIWGLPKAEEVLGSVLAVDTALGALLGLSKKNYDNSESRFDGVLSVDENDSRILHKLDLTTEPEDLGQKDTIELKVVKSPSE